MVVAILIFFWSWQPVRSVAPIIAEQPVIDHEAELREHASNVREAIYLAEGRCDTLHGKSGEYGCYQYQAGTWRAYSLVVAGEILPQTRANEDFVTEGVIKKWLEEGKSERWIFLTWNQGNGDGWGPGSKDCYAGINKHGVPYDSCEYAARALKHLEDLEKGPLPHEVAGETSDHLLSSD